MGRGSNIMHAFYSLGDDCLDIIIFLNSLVSLGYMISYKYDLIS